MNAHVTKNLTVLDAVEQIADFRNTNGVMPSQIGNTLESRRLYNWLRKIRAMHLAGDITSKEARAITKILPEWNQPLSRELEWWTKAEAAARFVRDFGRIPAYNTENAHEDFLANWIHRCANGAAAPLTGTYIDDVRRDFLDKHISGWDVPWEVRKAEAWSKRAAEFVAFVIDNGRMPGRKSESDDERALAYFRAAARAKKRGKLNPPLTEEQIKYLDDNAPGWTDIKDQNALWFENGQRLAQFIETHRSWPTGNKFDAYERALWRWHSDCRAAASGRNTKMRLNEERIAFLDSNLEGWRSSAADLNRLLAA